MLLLSNKLLYKMEYFSHTEISRKCDMCDSSRQETNLIDARIMVTAKKECGI